MPDAGDLARFYAEGYRAAGPESERLGAWRALGARAKADHVIDLCARAGLRPQRVLELGCGDGALLAELAGRRFAPRLVGLEISEPAVALARGRGIPGLERVEAYDGHRLPLDLGRVDLAIASHVVEHVPEPVPLLAQLAAVAAAVVVEVPLEANLSARRAAKRATAAEIGHLAALSAAEARRIVAAAGFELVDELTDPLPRAAHLFFARGPVAQARAEAKAAVRRAVFAASPRLAERLFTVHWAGLATPRPPGRAEILEVGPDESARTAS